MQNAHRDVSPKSIKLVSLNCPFSSFNLIDNEFQGIPAIRRCFSLARSFHCKTLLIEDISPAGIIEEENVELLTLYPQYVCRGLKRLSFWKSDFQVINDLANQNNNDFVGYVILKRDYISTQNKDQWHIFEAVFKKYEHKHNCVPSPNNYDVSFCDKRFSIKGILYCQQNTLNKSCAHVALRSLLSRLIPNENISYRMLNKIAQQVSSKPYHPSDGLTVACMQEIFKAFSIGYADLDYEKTSIDNPNIRTDIPYQKHLYAGIESGCGGLLGFSMSGPMAKDAKHIIPFYGHTFNKDTWAPDADMSYFNIGGGVGYIPSEMWTSSFIGHDDNFGPNFCVPRLYVKPEQVQYVVELKKSKACYGGIIAEAQALQFLYSLHSKLEKKNQWIKRLRTHSDPKNQTVVLRALCIEQKEYLTHLSSIQCWKGKKESSFLIDALSGLLPELLWVVEISIPHLFPANERKLGEIVLNATLVRDDSKEMDYKLFLLARLPEHYYLINSTNQYGPNFIKVPSEFVSHTPLIQTIQ